MRIATPIHANFFEIKLLYLLHKVTQLHIIYPREEYLKAACPTCESMRCAEGQECQMDGDLPKCFERIPGGCEVDKCGAGQFIVFVNFHA